MPGRPSHSLTVRRWLLSAMTGRRRSAKVGTEGLDGVRLEAMLLKPNMVLAGYAGRGGLDGRPGRSSRVVRRLRPILSRPWPKRDEEVYPRCRRLLLTLVRYGRP